MICMKTEIKSVLWIKTKNTVEARCFFVGRRFAVKKKISLLVVLLLLCSLLFAIPVYAIGEGNIDGGGGGMGGGPGF